MTVYVFVLQREDMVGLDASIIMHPDVWVASGHVEQFHDMLVDCKECKHRFRADHLESDRCPDCGGELTEPKAFNCMLKTQLGVSEDTAVNTYLRPRRASQSLWISRKSIQRRG